MGGNQSQHSPMARPHPFSAINRRAFDATISKATLSPPLPGLITRNSLHEFLNVALRFPEHSALRDVQRDYERELRALNVLTLNDVLDAQDSTIDQVFRRNKSYKSRVQDAIGVAKSLFPVCNDVIVQDSVVENSMTWRVSSVEVKTSLYTVMKITFAYECLFQQSSQFFKHEMEVESSPGIGFPHPRKRFRMELSEEEYIAGYNFTVSSITHYFTSITFITNTNRKLECTTNAPKNMDRPGRYDAPSDPKGLEVRDRNGSLPMTQDSDPRATQQLLRTENCAIMGLSVGFKRLETSSGITNLLPIVFPVAELSDATSCDVPSADLLTRQVPSFYVNPQAVSVTHLTAAQKEEQRRARERQNRRRVNAATGEYDDKEGDGAASSLTLPPPAPKQITVETFPYPDRVEEDVLPFQPPSPNQHIIMSAEFRAEFLVGPVSLDTFEEPIIMSDGYTYEELHIVEWLKTRKTSPMTGADFKYQGTKMKKNLLVKKLLSAGSDEQKVKALCTCPLTNSLFKVPVLFYGDELTYEKHALENYLRPFVGNSVLKARSPCTGEVCDDLTFVENYTIKGLLETARDKAKKGRAASVEWNDDMWSSLRDLGSPRNNS